MRSSVKNVLVTGVTGLIGGEIAARLSKEVCKVWALVRASSAAHAVDRVKIRFARSGRNVPPNILPICGNIRRKSLGIDRGALSEIREECDLIVHAAGNTSFKDDNGCYSTNVGGACEIIREVKSWNKPVRIFFLSTSFVSCSPEHSEIAEDSPQVGYANSYIKSKRQVERLFRRSGLDVLILRLSIVASRGIRDRKFARSVLWFVPIVLELGKVPLDREAMVDIVPVDYVVECVAMLAKRDTAFKCYHLTAGAKSSVNCQAIADKFNKRGNENVIFVSQRKWLQEKRAAQRYRSRMDAIELYVPFLNSGVTYSCDRIQKELGDEMPKCPKFTEYCKELLDLITHEEALAESIDP